MIDETVVEWINEDNVEWHEGNFQRGPTYEKSLVSYANGGMSGNFVSSSVKFSEINIYGVSDCGNVSKHLLEFRHKIRSKAFVVLNHRKMPDVFHNGEPASRDKLGSGLGHCGCS